MRWLSLDVRETGNEEGQGKRERGETQGRRRLDAVADAADAAGNGDREAGKERGGGGGGRSTGRKRMLISLRERGERSGQLGRFMVTGDVGFFGWEKRGASQRCRFSVTERGNRDIKWIRIEAAADSGHGA